MAEKEITGSACAKKSAEQLLSKKEQRLSKKERSALRRAFDAIDLE
jgi:hypothetical protein